MTAINPQANLLLTAPAKARGSVRMKARLTHRAAGRQRGAVLIVGLIILVVLTLLGVQALRGNLAQERMSYNVRERNAAFQAAEAALRVGEGVGPFPSATAALADPLNWVAADATGTVPGFDAGLNQDPIYHVGPPQYIRIGVSLPPEWRLIYPVSSRGVGGQEGSVVILQSGFEPPN
jgi:type IV pilus assembly protein PilX